MLDQCDNNILALLQNLTFNRVAGWEFEIQTQHQERTLYDFKASFGDQG